MTNINHDSGSDTRMKTAIFHNENLCAAIVIENLLNAALACMGDQRWKDPAYNLMDNACHIARDLNEALDVVNMQGGRR